MIEFFRNIALRIVSIFFTIIIFSIIISTFNFIGNLTSKTAPDKKAEIKEEVEKLSSHFHYWSDNKARTYSGTVSVIESDVILSKLNKKYINPSTWNEFYKNISEYDQLKISSLYKLFDRIYATKVLTRHEFADVIVTFTQNIPYSLLTMESCYSAYYNNKSVKEMIDQGIECFGDVYGGIFTPTEFISNFSGDCDTRTVFLYTILKRYNYDVVILNSDFYAHSIIGVNLPWRGKYKYHLGKRYYTWETTNINWQLGDIPAKTSNMDMWWVAL